MIAVLAVAVLGTVLNDGGASVWLVGTAAAAAVVGAFLIDEFVAGLPAGPADEPRRRHRSGSPANSPAPDPFGRRTGQTR